MGARPPGQDDGHLSGAESPVAQLERWEAFGAGFRVEHLADARAVVQLTTCTGEPVERIESADPELITFLRARQTR